MTKVINGKKYSTETAEMVGYDGFARRGNFKWWCERLYLKVTGEYFLHGMGGPLSHYRQKIGQNEWSGSEKIIPMTYPEAKAWAKKHLNYDKYITLFDNDIK